MGKLISRAASILRAQIVSKVGEDVFASCGMFFSEQEAA